MSRVISKDLITWYQIRDLLTGTNRKTSDIPKALELAKTCNHPDAIWLNDLNVKTKEEFINVLVPLVNDKNALCYLYFVKHGSYDMIIKSANLGCVYAKYLVGINFGISDMLDIMRKLEGERNAHYLLGFYGESTKENLEYAISLGHVDAIFRLAQEYSLFDIEHWRLVILSKVDMYLKQSLRLLGSNTPSYQIQYLIGKSSDNTFRSFYLSQNDKCRKAVDTWTLVATRLRIYKDLRIFIGKMIWVTRNEGIYLDEEGHF